MAQTKRTCLSCSNPFVGRRDAKTCSARCRKKLQRAKANLATELAAIEASAKKTIRQLEAGISLAHDSQQGFLGEADPTESVTPPALPVEEPTVAFSTSEKASASTEPNFTPPPPFDPKTLAPLNPISGQGEKPDAPELFVPSVEAPAFNTYQPPKPKLKTIGSVNEEALDNKSQQSPTVSSVSSPPLVLSSKSLAGRILVILGLILIGGILAIFVSYRSNQEKNLASGNLNINQTIGNNDEIEVQLKQALLKVNRNLKIADGKFFTATGQVLIQNESNSVNAFNIQGAEGNPLLIVDTKNAKVGIGAAPTGTATLQVSGPVTSSATVSANGGASSFSNQGLGA
jgi:hypothetical protein